MADNVTANAGTGGATFAADDIGGVYYPRTKIAHGADGAATDVSTASPLPVAENNAASVGGGTATKGPQLMGASSGSVVAVAVNASGHVLTREQGTPTIAAITATVNAVLTTSPAVTITSGNVTEASAASVKAAVETQAAALASVGGPVSTKGPQLVAANGASAVGVAANSSGHILVREQGTPTIAAVTATVSAVVTSALPAGTNAIGKLAANSGVDIGDVTVNETVNVVVTTAPTVAAVTASVKIDTANMPMFPPSSSWLKGVTSQITDTSATQVIASVVGKTINITGLLVTNAHASTGTQVNILDDTTTIASGYAAAAGGGFAFSPNPPLQVTSGKPVRTQMVTTGAAVLVTITAFSL